MALAISVADSNARSLGAYSCSFSINGAAGAIAVDLHRVKTRARLAAALAAAAQGYTQHRGDWKDRSEPNRESVGPFGGACFDNPQEHVVMVLFRDGWTADLVASSLTTGPRFGPHAVAIVLDRDVSGHAGTLAAGVAGALRAIGPMLPE